MKLLKLALASTAMVAFGGLAQAEISDDVVKIGVLNDRSGVYADLSGEGSVVAARMAVEDFGGKVDGKAIEVLSADHQNKTDIGSSIARQWIDQDGVDVIVDVPTSSVALAIQQVTSEKDTAFLNSGAATTALTNDQCAPTFVHWTYDTYALSVGTGKAMVEEGGKTWFFLTADYAFGHQLQKDTAAVIEANGGKVIGEVNHPLSTADFSSFLLQAQASGADVIGLANAGTDMTNSVKQANSFGIVQSGQKLAALLGFIADIHALGLDVAQGLTLTTGFYWDRTDETRKFAERFAERMNGQKPTMIHAGVYSGVMHYLKAVEEIDDDGGEAAVTQMKKMPINDWFAENGMIREDGRMVHDMYLVQVKKPSESKEPWDYYTIVRTIPGDEAFQPLDKSTCKLVKK
ncbi:MAG: ABC transporter substrate-binding protein [Rhodospirillales bacterium]|nr:ABC transporter substrate-binding protein [Rhodospirillales bacterium]